jgi:hypothetical protein
MAFNGFQCLDCGFGDYEVGHLVADDDTYCIVCLEEQGRWVRVHSWPELEPYQARSREALVA